MPETTSLNGMMSSVLTGTLSTLTGTLTGETLTMTCDGAADFDWSMIPSVLVPWGHHRACSW